ncbi:MAG: TonB family protein [Pseudomonadales bacterium]
MASASITPRDRLLFTLFLAASLHAAVILGVSFAPDLQTASSPTIEVTLARYSEPEAPEDADFIAEANQLGSGTEAEALETTTTRETEFQSNELREVTPDPVPRLEAVPVRQRELLAAEVHSDEKVTTQEQVPVEAVQSPLTAANLSYDNIAQEIASLEARIAQEQQDQAKRPRVRRLTSVSSKSAVEAGYLNAWRQRVERIGNANYPAGGLYGNLRLLVVVRFDGSLEEVRILESSGRKSLDDAALNIVRLAAPFQSFPVEMRKHYDELEIIRTWQFSRSGATIGS